LSLMVRRRIFVDLSGIEFKDYDRLSYRLNDIYVI